MRQGPPLAENLRRYLTGQPLKPFVPQTSFLSLISAGGRYAVGTKGWLSAEGGWLWRLKDRIDRSFMDKCAPVGSSLLRMRGFGCTGKG